MRIHRREWAAISIIVAACVGLRIGALTPTGLLLGWDSDAATFGLMAGRLYERGEFPIFFWGQSYLGPLTSYVAAGIALLRIEPRVGPFTLRLASLLLIVGGLIGYWLGLRRAFGRTVAMLAALWLAIGPRHHFASAYAPVGSEQLFFLSGVVFAHVMRGLERRRDSLVLGLLCGIGWWIHQGIVFVAGAALVVVAWNRGIRLPPLPDHIATRIVNALLLVWLGANVLMLIAGTPGFFLGMPIVEPLAVWLAFRLLFARELLRTIDWTNVALATAGALVGYAPVIIGSWVGAIDWIYEFSAPPRELVDMPAQIALIARTAFWEFIGADTAPWSLAVGAGIVLLIVGRLAGPGDSEAAMPPILRHYPAMICAASLAFFIASGRATANTVRYVVPALPIVYAFAADGALRMGRGRWKPVAAIAVLAITIGLVASRVAQMRDLLAARAEYSLGLDAIWDPRPAIAEIERRGYTVCAADYWSAYKLEFLLDERVRFIVRNSYDRRPARSRLLKSLPVRKCLVDPRTGHISEYDPRIDEGAIAKGARARAGHHATR